MKRNELKGLYAALLVPFEEDGSLNEAGLRQVIRHDIDQMKLDGLYVGGSTGENFLVDTAMKKRIFQIAKEEAGDAVQLIAQVGGSNVYEAIELGNYVKSLGYQTISAVTPFYYQFSSEELIQYYQDIVGQVGLELIIYSIPALTGVNLSLEDYDKLFAIEGIIGVKFTTADFYLLERLRKTYPDKLIFFGVDEMLLSALPYQIDGAIGSTYNVNGLGARRIINAFHSGDMDLALEEQGKTNDLIQAILANGLYPTLKRLLQEQGCDAGGFYPRKPFAAQTEAQIQEADAIYNRYLKN